MQEDHYIQPPTGESLEAHAKKHSLAYTPAAIGVRGVPEFTLHEFRLNPEARSNGSVLLYFHGGGYVLPISGPGHVPLTLSCGRAAGVDTVIFLEYSLAPAVQCPGQLAQAVETIRFLLRQRQIQPEKLIIGGDSAGGNLALGLLAHIKQKHPQIPALDEMDGKQFKAVYGLSPWITMSTTAKSFPENEFRDHIAVKKMNFFIDLWNPTSDIWAEPLRADPAFWQGIAAKKILLTAGMWECFADDIIEMATKLKDGGADIELVKGEKEAHVQGVLDEALGVPQSGSTQRAIDWLKGLQMS